MMDMITDMYTQKNVEQGLNGNVNFSPEVVRYIKQEMRKKPNEDTALRLGQAFALCVTRHTKGDHALIDNTTCYPRSDFDSHLMRAFWDKVEDMHTLQIFGVVPQRQPISAEDVIEGIKRKISDKTVEDAPIL